MSNKLKSDKPSKLELITKASKDVGHGISEVVKYSSLFVFSQPYFYDLLGPAYDETKEQSKYNWPTHIMASAMVSLAAASFYLLATKPESNIHGPNTALDYCIALIPAATNTLSFIYKYSKGYIEYCKKEKVKK
jgi:hypothetical protein